MSKLETITIDTPSGSNTMQIGSTNTATINLGVSGDTINVPAGVTIANAGTATGFGENNTPYFIATMSGSDQSVSSGAATKAAFNSQTAATSGTYDTSNYRFTPGVSGTYQVYGRLFTHASGVTFRAGFIYIYKNGSSVCSRGFSGDSTYIDYLNVDISHTLSLNTTDYIECYGKVTTSNDANGSFNTGTGSLFTAQRVII